MEFLKEVLSPSAFVVVAVLAALAWLMWRLERGREQLVEALSAEVRRRTATVSPAPEVRVQTPLMTAMEDPPVRHSECDLHRSRSTGDMMEMRARLERMERRLDEDIRRLHDRIDDLPGRIIELLASARSARGEH